VSAGYLQWDVKSADSRVQFVKMHHSARIIWRGFSAFFNIPAFSRLMPGLSMKAKITITPKKAVLDPQGKAVQNALEHMGYTGVGDVHVGRYLEIEVEGEREAVEKQIDEACHKLLSNPVIEEYRFELE
jgi:phosphoribosylformylglycinamidine synthase PurS subunit